MSDVRQLPLFPNQPASAQDLNPYTELRHTVSLFQRFLLKEGKTQHTVNAFTADLQLLAAHTGDDTPIGEYTTSRLNDFLDWLEHGRGVPCSRKSYARRVTTLKVYFKWLSAIGALEYDPAKPILQRSGPAPLSAALSLHEIRAAVLTARDIFRGDIRDTRPEMLFRLLLNTGIKKSEAIALKPEDIDRSNPLNPVMTVKHKARNPYKERRIELDPDWVKLLDDYLIQYAPRETIFNCTARNLEYILSDLGTAAGIPFKLSFEIMRWTCAVQDTRAELDEEFIREKLGLSPISWIETRAKIKRLIEQQEVRR